MLLMESQVVMTLGNALLVALPPTLIALTGLITAIQNGHKTDKVKTLVNGRMDELLRNAVEKAYHEGHKQGILDGIEKTKEIAEPLTRVQLAFDQQFLGREVVIRDKATGSILCRRHSSDPEVLEALNNPDKIVE